MLALAGELQRVVNVVADMSYRRDSEECRYYIDGYCFCSDGLSEDYDDG